MSRSIVTQATSGHRATGAMLQLMRRLLRDRGDGIRGVAAIEFAVIAMLLVVMTIGTVDFGMGFYRKMQVYNAAQAGAHYAIMHGYDESKVAASIKAAVKDNPPSFTFDATPAPRRFCGCPSSAGVTEVAALTPCTFTCPDGSIAGTYVRASAQGAYETILRYPALIPNSLTFSSQSTVRIP
jgi:Flp pilus assembly pilin Flp